MQPTDLDAVLAIQDACYTEIVPESKEAYIKKLQLSPSSCFVAHHLGNMVGYLIAIPSQLQALPALNSTLLSSADSANCLYLHDLAVIPAASGLGVGKVLVHRFFQSMSFLGFEQAALIAIQNAAGFWQKQGFVVSEPIGASKQALRSYGADGCVMQFEINRAV